MHAMLSLLSKFFASLLVPILFIGIVGFTLRQTVFSSHYLEGQLQKTNAYSKLATGINQNIAKNSADHVLSEQQISSQLSTIITPAVVQQKLNTTLDQIQTYYQGKGPVPTIDVSDLVAKAQAAGLPAPQDNNLTKPIELTPLKKAQEVNNKLKLAKLLVAVGTLLLIVGMVAIAFVRRNFKPLANVLISLGVLVSLLGGGLLLVPSILNKAAKLNFQTDSFATVGHDLATNMAQSLGARFLAEGIALLLVGIVARVVMGKLHRPTRQASAPAPATPVSSDPALPAKESFEKLESEPTASHPVAGPPPVPAPKPVKKSPPKIQL